VFVLKLGFLAHSLGEQLRPSPYTFLSRQSRFPIPVRSPWNKGKRWYTRPQISKYYWSGTGISTFILPLLWKSDEQALARNHGK